MCVEKSIYVRIKFLEKSAEKEFSFQTKQNLLLEEKYNFKTSNINNNTKNNS